MTFNASTYVNFVSESSEAQDRLFLQYIGPRNDFDIIIVGSGIGGGILADDLADRLGNQRRILVLEAGSFVYPTHVYNLSRFSNASLARHFGCDTFWQGGDSNSQNFIGEKPQLNLGGRSIFWSGLIPSIQGWELDFFPARVRQDLAGGLLNQSRRYDERVAIDGGYRGGHRNEAAAKPAGAGFLHPGNTARPPPALLGAQRNAQGPVLYRAHRCIQHSRAAHQPGGFESPKLLRRSSMYPSLPESARSQVGRGLTDHATSNESLLT